MDKQAFDKILPILEAFFDSVIFFLMGMTGLLTAYVVWFEARFAREPIDREKRAIIYRSIGFGLLFIWAFFRAFVSPLGSDIITWTLRGYLLCAMVNYLVVLIRSFRRRHGISLKYLISDLRRK